MKTGIVIELNGPATIQEEEALYGGGDARIVRVEGGEITGIEIYRGSEAKYHLRIFPNGKLVLTTYQGVLTMTADTNLSLTPSSRWEE